MADVCIDETRLSVETVTAVRELVDCIRSGRSFRAQMTVPFIVPLEGCDVIECGTSGSSGNPKIVRRSLQSWTASFAINRDLFAFGPDDRAAVFGAIGHSLTVYGITEAIHCDLAVHFLYGLRPKTQMEHIVDHRISVLYATPTQLRMLTGGATDTVRVVLCGGGNLDQATRDHVRRMFPRADLREFYGASETSFVTLADGNTPAGSVGMPYPGVVVEIRNAGEVWVKSPYLFDCYALGDSASTRRDGDFVTVGEVGRLDSAGYLYLLGRQDRMITIADRNVHPEALENLLGMLMPDCLAVVAAVADDRRGHVLVAYIAHDGNRPDEAWLRRAITDRLGGVMVPRKIIWTRDLPLLPSGKPDLHRLRMDNPWP